MHAFAPTGRLASMADDTNYGSLGALAPNWDEGERNIDTDEIYERFFTWVEDVKGVEPWPHQEEAIMDLLAGDHVILNTPTGSGKSMIALAAHTASLAHGGRSYYTAPLKALVSEKFFELVRLFGADNVGMVTGDTSINAAAPIICCTAEILANQSLREGEDMDVDCVIMDEFHYYADPQRGWAWQVPLLELPQAQMVLLSATLGDVSFFVRDLRERPGREVAVVDDAVRPVPLEMEYVVEPIGELLQRLVGQDKAPIYVVHFSQKEAVERATSLLSVDLVPKSRKAEVAKALGDFRFGSGFGATLSRLLRAGIGVHHAGMLPRYRRLVERLAREGLLSVICGTDTLGVGINVPIRSVVMTSLVKFDGSKERHLTAREFHQIAGRAGRAGFDTRGYVSVQAPEHVIENAKALAKAGDDERKRRKIVRKKAPEGRVNWTDKTFERLRDAAPETLTSQFQVTTTMVLNLMERAGDPVAAMAELLERAHEPEAQRRRHVRRALEIYLSLRTAGVLTHVSSAQAAAESDDYHIGRIIPARLGQGIATDSGLVFRRRRAGRQCAQSHNGCRGHTSFDKPSPIECAFFVQCAHDPFPPMTSRAELPEIAVLSILFGLFSVYCFHPFLKHLHVLFRFLHQVMRRQHRTLRSSST